MTGTRAIRTIINIGLLSLVFFMFPYAARSDMNQWMQQERIRQEHQRQQTLIWQQQERMRQMHQQNQAFQQQQQWIQQQQNQALQNQNQWMQWQLLERARQLSHRPF
jgi:methionine salvage enolase-phosphatase E1